MRSMEEMDQADQELRAAIQKSWPMTRGGTPPMVDLLVPPPEETGPGKLTVGKIYGGMLLLENWKLSRFGRGWGGAGHAVTQRQHHGRQRTGHGYRTAEAALDSWDSQASVPVTGWQASLPLPGREGPLADCGPEAAQRARVLRPAAGHHPALPAQPTAAARAAHPAVPPHRHQAGDRGELPQLPAPPHHQRGHQPVQREQDAHRHQ